MIGEDQPATDVSSICCLLHKHGAFAVKVDGKKRKSLIHIADLDFLRGKECLNNTCGCLPSCVFHLGYEALDSHF